MRILLVNRFSPPDPAPTATLLGELGGYLEREGWEVGYLQGARRSYREGAGGGRLIELLHAHIRILWHGLRSPRPDVVLCLSDPPCLVFTAWILARIHRARLAHWCMELYPEVAVALGEISGGPLSRGLRNLQHWCYRQCHLCIALDHDMAARLHAGENRVKVLAPWPPSGLKPPAEAPPRDTRFRWLYSGNLGRAHTWRPLLEAQRILERNGRAFELVFQGRGAAMKEAQAAAADLRLQHCHFRDYAPPGRFLQSLMEADAHVVTLRPQLTGMLLPSKLSLLLHLPQPLIWIGDPEAAAAEAVRSHAAGGIALSPEAPEALADHLEELAEKRETGDSPPNLPPLAEADAGRAASLRKIRRWLDKVAL